MKVAQMYRTALIATMMLIVSSGLGMRGFAQANSPQGVRNIVLVHGAWADGSCWSRATSTNYMSTGDLSLWTMHRERSPGALKV